MEFGIETKALGSLITGGSLAWLITGAIKQAFKGRIPSRAKPLIAIVVGAGAGVVFAYAVGYTDPQSLVLGAFAGIAGVGTRVGWKAVKSGDV